MPDFRCPWPSCTPGRPEGLWDLVQKRPQSRPLLPLLPKVTLFTTVNVYLAAKQEYSKLLRRNLGLWRSQLARGGQPEYEQKIKNHVAIRLIFRKTIISGTPDAAVGTTGVRISLDPVASATGAGPTEKGGEFSFEWRPLLMECFPLGCAGLQPPARYRQAYFASVRKTSNKPANDELLLCIRWTWVYGLSGLGVSTSSFLCCLYVHDVW